MSKDARLQIATDFSLPIDAVTGTFGLLAIRGSGPETGYNSPNKAGPTVLVTPTTPRQENLLRRSQAMPLVYPSSVLTRFWAKVEKSQEPDCCWLWTGYLRNGIHGSLWVDGKNAYVHRLSYEIHIGPIPTGLEVCHRCDVGNCVNPAHLFLGTHIVNVADMNAKGRGSKPPTHFGSSHPQATLSDDQVAEIRRLVLVEGWKQRDVATQFGVSQSTVWRLAHGLTRAVQP